MTHSFPTRRSSDLPVARELVERGWSLVATGGPAAWLRENGLECAHVNKVAEARPHIVDLIKNGELASIVNTTEGRQAIADSFPIRPQALHPGRTHPTTIAAPRALPHSRAHMS